MIPQDSRTERNNDEEEPNYWFAEFFSGLKPQYHTRFFVCTIFLRILVMAPLLILSGLDEKLKMWIAVGIQVNYITFHNRLLN